MASIVRSQQAHSVAEFSSTGVEDHRCQAEIHSSEGCNTKRRLRIRRRARKSRREEEVVILKLQSEKDFPSLMKNATTPKSYNNTSKSETKSTSKLNFEIMKSTRGYPCIVAQLNDVIHQEERNNNNNNIITSLPYTNKLDYKEALNTKIGSFGRFKIIGNKRVKSDININNNIILNNNDIILYKDITTSSLYNMQKKSCKKPKRERVIKIRMVRKMNTRSLYKYNINNDDLFINIMTEIKNKINKNSTTMGITVASIINNNININKNVQ